MDPRLKKAACTGNTAEIKALMEAKKIRFDTEDEFKRTALHHVASCKAPSAESCARLLLTDAKLEQKLGQIDSDEKTPLLIAAYCGSPAIYPLLDAKPKSINQLDRRGLSALHNVVMSGILLKKDKYAFTLKLLEAGADVNVEDIYHRTAIHCANGMGRDYPNNLETIVLLVLWKAIINRPDQIFYCLEAAGTQDYSDRGVYDVLLKLQEAYHKKITREEKARYWGLENLTDREIIKIQKTTRAKINERIKKLSKLYNYVSKKEHDVEEILEAVGGLPKDVAKIVSQYARIKFFKPFFYSKLEEVNERPNEFKLSSSP